MARLPRILDMDGTCNGAGFFLCTRKERRTGQKGAFLALMLQDVSGEIGAKVFTDVDISDAQFEVGEFVAIQGRGNLFHQRLELVLDKIRRVIPDDANRGFREEDCIRSSPRSAEEMWAELESRIATIEQPALREVIARVVTRYADRLRVWPAAVTVHHDYRGGLLEHVLKITEVVVSLAAAYGASRDLLIAGAIVHDIGKLEELSYSLATTYTTEGNLVGHITIGVGIVRDAAREVPDLPHDVLLHLEHLILSHHGSRDRGSPVEPMTVEAFILASTDNLDATIHQVRRHIADDDSDGPFTSYHRRLERVLLKPS
jgi:3'-5' exoribonuclease